MTEIPGRLLRILILEANATDAELLQRALTHANLRHTDLVVATEAGYLEALNSFNPDLVLSDYRLPGYSGLQALSALREQDKSLPFIFVSAGVSETDLMESMRLGAINYVLKDNLEHLPMAITSALEEAEQKGQLARSEERYRLLTESIQEGIWDWNTVDNTIYFSPTWKAQLGYEDDELENQLSTWENLLHPEDKQRVSARLDEFLTKAEHSWNEEFRLRHKQGHYVWINARGTTVVNDEHRVVHIVGVHIDISERKKAEYQFELYRQIISTTRDMMSFVDNNYRYQIVNEAYSKFWNKPSTQIIGHTVGELLGQELFEKVSKPKLDRCLAGESINFQHSFIDSMGNTKHLDVTYHPYRNPDGEVTGVVVVSHDVTSLQQAREKALQAAEVFKSTIEGVTITDLQGRIIDVNQAFTDITGYQREDVIGQNPRVLQSGRHDSGFYQDMWRELLNSGSWRGEIWNKNKDGTVYPEMLTISTVHDENGQPTGYVGVFSDITSAKQTEEKLEFMAHHDPLTSLPNRMLFNARLSHSIRVAHRQQQKLGLMFIDLDRFKNINDTLGHSAGDEVLKELAVRLKHSVRSDDTVARLSGDEFIVLLNNIENAEHVAVVVEKIMQTFDMPFALKDNDIRMTCSIGISLYPTDGESTSDLLRNADTAMYRAKEEGRNSYQFYRPEMTTLAMEHVFIENALRTALDNNQFYLVYQPQFDIVSGAQVGVEALLRWQHPEQGLIPPTRFIPVAEQSGIIISLGKWVLEQAIGQAKRWQQMGLNFGRIAVNVAAPQLQQADFTEQVKQQLARHDMPASMLELEVTETFVMQHLETTTMHLQQLHELGILIAIDDFGTGYSSLSYLKSLPIDKLKLDRSFVRDIPDDINDIAISEAVIALARALKMKVIAEGVENSQQAELLRSKGCNEAQGYYFGKPMPAGEIEKMMLQTQQVELPG